ncbi:hypothetical protein VPHD480_0172 [Vibrio phage D480]
MKKRHIFLLTCVCGAIAYFAVLFFAALLYAGTIEFALSFVVIVFIALLNIVRAEIQNNDKAP